MKKGIGILSGLVLCVLLVLAVSILDSTGATQAAKADVSRGEYLVQTGGCSDCHTPKIMTPKGPTLDESKSLSGAPANIKVPAVPPGLIAPNGWGFLGTNDMTAFAGPWGISYAANLTPDKNTGMGTWTEAAFVKGMRTGKHKGVMGEILPPMPWQGLSKMTDQDLKAIFAYLGTLKPIANKVPEAHKH
jgi:cytochrome c553